MEPIKSNNIDTIYRLYQKKKLVFLVALTIERFTLQSNNKIVLNQSELLENLKLLYHNLTGNFN